MRELQLQALFKYSEVPKSLTCHFGHKFERPLTSRGNYVLYMAKWISLVVSINAPLHPVKARFYISVFFISIMQPLSHDVRSNFLLSF